MDDGFGPQIDPEEEARDLLKNARVVVLKHMFTLDDLEKDPTLLLDLKEEVREECTNLGEVTNVVLFDVRQALLRFHFLRNLKSMQKEKDGVMTVKFKNPISAHACVAVRGINPQRFATADDDPRKCTDGFSTVVEW